jgi:hypothetical protein
MIVEYLLCLLENFIRLLQDQKCSMVLNVRLLTLQQNTPITTRVITTKMIIVVIHVLLHQFIRFRCKSYLKTGNLLLQK